MEESLIDDLISGCEHRVEQLTQARAWLGAVESEVGLQRLFGPQVEDMRADVHVLECYAHAFDVCIPLLRGDVAAAETALRVARDDLRRTVVDASMLPPSLAGLGSVVESASIEREERVLTSLVTSFDRTLVEPGISQHVREVYLNEWFSTADVLMAEIYRAWRQLMPDEDDLIDSEH